MAKLIDEMKWGAVLGVAQQRMDISRSMIAQTAADIFRALQGAEMGSAEWSRLQRLANLADGVMMSLQASDKILTGLVIDMLDDSQEMKESNVTNEK